MVRVSKFALVALFLGVTIYTLWSQSLTTPADALSRAFKLSRSTEAANADPFVRITLRDQTLRHWGQLIKAQLLEKQGKHSEAIAHYRRISERTPASLDARVAVLRLEQELDPIALSKEISSLEETAQRVRRKDMLAEIALLRAKQAEHNGDFAQAFKRYREVRRTHRNPDVLKRARAAFDKLTRTQPTLLDNADTPSLLDEARIRFREKDYLGALEVVERLKTQNKSPHFEAMLLEEKILRKESRHEEADRLLLIISADGEQGTADKAMMRIAKNHWNVDNHHRALQFLDNLKTRFPKSDQRDEALYVEARILEEIKQLAEAKKIYEQLAKEGRDPLLQIRALNRIAWLYLRSENIIFAVKSFAKVASVPVDAENKRQRKIEDEQKHARFWQGYALSQLTKEDRKTQSFQEPRDILVTLAENSPFHYYGFLARSFLELPTPNEPQSNAECLEEIPENLLATLAALHSAKLVNFSRYEIDWHLAGKDSARTTDSAIRERTRAYLYSNYGNTGLGISLAQRQLARDLENCRELLVQLSFPLPFLNEFRSAAKTHSIPLELLFSVARTESKFDPEAISPVGARGIVQLMRGHSEPRRIK